MEDFVVEVFDWNDVVVTDLTVKEAGEFVSAGSRSHYFVVHLTTESV